MKFTLPAAAALGLLGLGLAFAADVRPAATRSGIDLKEGDPKIRPQDDLYRHVNGKWLAEAVIPPDRSSDGAFYKLRDQAEADLRVIIEEAAAKSDSTPEARKVGDLFASYLDEKSVEARGLKPIADELALVDSVTDKAGLLKVMGTLQRTGVDGLFGLYVDTDAKKSDRYIVYLNQGGLGLPDEAYYRDAKFEPIRKAYSPHIKTMFELSDQAEAAAATEKVMALETLLARGHWDRVKSRDDTLTYNKVDRDALAKLAPGIDWGVWLGAIGAGDVQELVVRQPDFLTAAGKALDEVPIEDWKAWLRWHLVKARAPLLTTALVDEDFEFDGKVLTGAQELKPRWKRAVGAVEMGLGEAVGKLYVAKHFPPAAKARMNELVANLVEAYRQDIQTLEWMSPETRTKALEKLGKFTPKVGYPDKWRDYSKLEIKRDDLVGNIKRAVAFEVDRSLAKLGQPVDRLEWGMTPQTVNAYYNPGMNEIVFPAAILQPPFFDLEADDAANYGGIGAVIGHEIGHGFDDQGSKYDGEGNMKDWWTAADRKEFDARAKKLIAQYDAFEPAQLPGQHVNGALTIGENIGDLGGLTIAYKAYALARKGATAPVIDGLTGEQRFYIGWAQVWRTKQRDAELARRLATDPHSPPEFRCNGVVRNIPEFYKAFDVKPGHKLYLAPEQRVTIW
jgi:putative endopeptidase